MAIGIHDNEVWIDSAKTGLIGPRLDDALLELNTITEKKKGQTVTVAKSGGDFDSIQDAVDSITDASSIKQYLIKISPGIYTEDVINQNWVNFAGTGLSVAVLEGTLVLGANFEGRLMRVHKVITANETIVDASIGGGRITFNDFTIAVETATVGVKPVALSVNANSLYTENFQVNYTNTSGGAIAGDTNLVDLQGNGVYTINQSAFVCVSNQSSGNINFIKDNNAGVTSHALILGIVVLSNGSWNDTFSFIKQINNSSNKHLVTTLSLDITGAGLGICKALNNDSGGALSRIVNSRIFVNGFTERCIVNAENVGDEVDFTYDEKNEEIPDDEAFCGDGLIRLFARNDGEMILKNTDLVDLDILIGNPTNRSLQDMFDIGFGAGWVSGQEITDNLDGTTTVALGTGYVRTSNDEQSPLKSFDIAEFANQNYSVGENILYVDYNSNDPIVATTTNVDSILDNENDKYEIATVVKESDNSLHITRIYHRAKNVGARSQERIYGKERFQRADADGGWIISESEDGNRFVGCTGGKGTVKLNKILLTDFDTAITGSFDRYYSNGAVGFTKQIGQTTWDNTQYDDGSGILALVGVGKYSWQDMYRETDGDIVLMYGNDTYNSIAGASIVEPYSVPVRIQKHAKFVGRIVFRRDATIASTVLSPFTQILVSTGGISIHSNLAGLGWSGSGHTGTALKLAGFDAGGLATEFDRNPFNQDLNTTDSPTFAGLDVDNININGNTIISTDVNGDINIIPHGTGDVVIGDLKYNGNIIRNDNVGGDIEFQPEGNATGDEGSVIIKHFGSAGSGGSYQTNSALILDSVGECQLQMLSSNDTSCRILFGDPEDNDIGSIRYSHLDEKMTFVVNTIEAMTIFSSGNIELSTSSNLSLPVAAVDAGNLLFEGTTYLGNNGLRLFSLMSAGGSFIDCKTDLATKGLIFRCDTGVGSAQRMKLQADGNIIFNSGLGTTATGVGFNSVYINTSTWEVMRFTSGWFYKENKRPYEDFEKIYDIPISLFDEKKIGGSKNIVGIISEDLFNIDPSMINWLPLLEKQWIPEINENGENINVEVIVRDERVDLEELVLLETDEEENKFYIDNGVIYKEDNQGNQYRIDSYDKDRLIPMLVKTVQDQKNKIDTQQEQINNLITRVEALEGNE